MMPKSIKLTAMAVVIISTISTVIYIACHLWDKAAMSTCMPSCYNVPYMLFNLQGEVGELSSKIAKAIRKEQAWFIDDENVHNQLMMSNEFDDINKEVEFEDALIGELGDVLWQLAGLSSVLGFTLENVAKYNINKLASRKQRGVIDGDGDKR